jgi:hypothetical protein
LRRSANYSKKKSEHGVTMMHGLIVVPYYFVGPLAVLPLLMVISRLWRLQVAINTLVGGALVLTFVSIVVPLALKWVSLAAFTGRPLAVLILLSFLFTALDAALARALPLPLDDELSEL